MVLRVVFIKLTLSWLQTGLSDLKTPNNGNFAYGRFFSIFKHVAFFKMFRGFLNSPALLNALNCI